MIYQFQYMSHESHNAGPGNRSTGLQRDQQRAACQQHERQSQEAADGRTGDLLGEPGTVLGSGQHTDGQARARHRPVPWAKLTAAACEMLPAAGMKTRTKCEVAVATCVGKPRAPIMSFYDRASGRIAEAVGVRRLPKDQPRGSYTYSRPKHFAWIRVPWQRRSVIWQHFWYRHSSRYCRRFDAE